MSEAPIVVVRIDASGDVAYLMSGPVDLFVVDERCPNDRVYRMTVQTPRSEIATVLGDDAIGSRNDDRHRAIAARVNAVADGRDHLTVVKP